MNFCSYMLPSRRKKDKDKSDCLKRKKRRELISKEVENNLFFPNKPISEKDYNSCKKSDCLNNSINIIKEKKHKIFLRKLRSSYGLCVIFAVMIIMVMSLNPIMGSLCSDSSSFLELALAEDSSENSCSSNLFAEPAKNFLKESLENSLVQENSLMAVSAPDIVTSKTLGMITSDDVSDEPRNGIIEYTVGPDDSLSSVAEKFGISEETILWANNLSSKSTLKSGQNLVILPVTGLMYFVEDGDTLEEIANEYKGDVKSIIAFNELKSEEDVYIGDVLVIPNGKIVPKATKPQAKDIPLADAYFIIPVEGRITQGLHFYNAIDIANSCGKPVVAAAGGKVQRAGWISSTGGNVVTILHPNGVVTYYGHLSAISVVPGQTVAAGQIIGNVGRTGYATGCHLHFDVRGGKNFMSKYPVGSTVSWKK